MQTLRHEGCPGIVLAEIVVHHVNASFKHSAFIS